MQNTINSEKSTGNPTANSLKVLTTAVEDAKAQKITVLDVTHLTTVTDAMIICSGTSSRHMRHIADSTLKAAQEADLKIISSEGLDSQDWIIVDAGDVIIHVMSDEGRDFYNLEGLWDMAEATVDDESS